MIKMSSPNQVEFLYLKKSMIDSNDNPLGLENKLYDIEEFGATLRNKFDADNNISNVMLAEIFLSQYPTYSCKIKKHKNFIPQKKCGCC